MCILTVTEADALAGELKDVTVMHEPVQEGAEETVIAEDLGPVAEGQVGGEQERASLVALADE